MNTEKDFHDAWINELKGESSPANLALNGGKLADRLAFLFLSGYQAAIRATFKNVKLEDWAAFAVSEDQSSDNPRPGVSINDNKLSGFKTWVAGSRHVQHLIITVGPPVGADLLHIPVERENLVLHHKEDVGFLSEMSQGIAEFRNTPVDAADYLESVNIRSFGRNEPLYLYIAFCGFLMTRADIDCEEQLEILRELTTANLETPESIISFADIDSSMSRMFDQVPDDVKKGNWEQDIGLVTLYSKGIQRRAEKIQNL